MLYDDGGYYYSATELFSSCLGSSTNNSNKKVKMMNKKRFSDEQVRSLESIFENETKLEPKKKVEVARQLGLQPRQVAIWFQNKRARYKSKQLEQVYALLKADYNALASQFENLKKENDSLFLQLEKLKHENEGHNRNKSEDEKSDKDKVALSMDYGASCILSSSWDEGWSENNNDNEDKKKNYMGLVVVEELVREHIGDDDEMLRMSSNDTVQLGVGSSCSLSEWDDYSDPEGLFDQQQTAVDSCNHWWDFWSN